MSKHGMPDWGSRGPRQTTFGLDDLGELAARLGSPVIWDRRGDLLMIDDFEQGCNRPAFVSSGTGADLALMEDRARWGQLSVQLTGGSDGQRYAGLRWTLPLPALSKIGFEGAFGYDENVSYILWRIDYYDGTKLHRANMAYFPATTRMRIQDDAGSWQTISSTVKLFATGDPVHAAKIVADFENGLYERAIIDQTTWVLSAYGIYLWSSSTLPKLDIECTVYSNTGVNGKAWVDGIIVTQNEP